MRLKAKKEPQTVIGELLRWGSRELKHLGYAEARASAERLLEEISGLDRFHLYLDVKRIVPKKNLRTYRAWIRRRKRRVPVAYIVKKVAFWNETLEVKPGCLIPRPETEVLVERFMEKSGFEKQRKFSFLDLGSGSGAIGIAILRHYPNARGTFSDKSKKALAVTRKNLIRYALLNRSTTVLSDLFKAFQKKRYEKWDVIFTNPPYIAKKDLKNLQPEVLREPRLALDGGKDGLETCRKIFRQGPEYLNPGGLLLMEFGKGQAKKIAKESSKYFKDTEIFKDHAGIARTLLARQNG
jgi:release factor glutamine methyltransferase